MTIQIGDIKEMEKFASSFVDEIISQEAKNKAIIVGLKGDLGAGKTVFAKGVAKALGVEGVVTSPTFVIEKIYKLPQEKRFSYLIHIDAYRLEKGEELTSLGWEEIVNNPQNLILIEWPERVADILPKDMMLIQFKFIDENTRKVSY